MQLVVGSILERSRQLRLIQQESSNSFIMVLLYRLLSVDGCMDMYSCEDTRQPGERNTNKKSATTHRGITLRVKNIQLGDKELANARNA
jgi:hypothetical protein